MKEPKASDAVRNHFETATPEEQKQFAEALLSSRTIVDRPARFVPDSIDFASRWLSTAVAILSAVSVGWSEQLLETVGTFIIIGAVAWFPNETAQATGRIGFGPAVSRSSHPWILFVVAWSFFVVIGLSSALEWVAG